MRVLTINVFSHHRYWSRRRRVLALGMGELVPDLVAFQEAVVTDQGDAVTEILGPEYHLLHQRGRSDDGGGASIASRWPIELVREAEIQFDRSLYRSCWIGSVAVVRIDVPEPIGPVLFVHHKPTWQSGAERERERQALATARLVEEIVAGRERMSSWPGNSTRSRMRRASAS